LSEICDPSLSLPRPRPFVPPPSENPRHLRTAGEETSAICASGRYDSSGGRSIDISGAIGACIDEAVLYRPTHVFGRMREGSGRGVVEVSEETVLQACQRIRSVFRDVPVAVLNFANAAKPGGGFLNGRRTQEAALCRASALYASISRFNEMYGFGRADENPLSSDFMIYSPKVPFFRDDCLALIDQPFCVSVITAAAPKAHECVRPVFRRAIRGTIKNRMRKIMQVAIEHGDRILVLGAFGCDVYKNDPTEVATVERELLIDEGFRYHFDIVLNPITTASGKRENLEAFQNVLRI
jgi:uncharacterized protein (TIGR02452 family)